MQKSQKDHVHNSTFDIFVEDVQLLMIERPLNIKIVFFIIFYKTGCGKCGPTVDGTHVVPICDSNGLAHVGPTSSPVAKPISDARIKSHMGPICFAGWALTNLTACRRMVKFIHKA